MNDRPSVWHRRPIALLVGYSVLGLVVTHLPPFWRNEPLEDQGFAIGFDKVVHFAGFGALALLAMNVLCRWMPTTWALVATVVFCGVAGVIDEVTQPPFGRTADLHDWIADMLGVITALAIRQVVTVVRSERKA
ncbi:MAG: VanZ family protein [Planctomycetota bacterium]